MRASKKPNPNRCGATAHDLRYTKVESQHNGHCMQSTVSDSIGRNAMPPRFESSAGTAFLGVNSEEYSAGLRGKEQTRGTFLYTCSATCDGFDNDDR